MNMKEDLQRRIEALEYAGLRGEVALEAAYDRICGRFMEPRSERDLLAAFFLGDRFQSLFDLYFEVHPETARQLVNAHDLQFKGYKKLLKPVAEFFQDGVYSLRYNSAKKALEANG